MRVIDGLGCWFRTIDWQKPYQVGYSRHVIKRDYTPEAAWRPPRKWYVGNFELAVARLNSWVWQELICVIEFEGCLPHPCIHIVSHDQEINAPNSRRDSTFVFAEATGFQIVGAGAAAGAPGSHGSRAHGARWAGSQRGGTGSALCSTYGLHGSPARRDGVRRPQGISNRRRVEALQRNRFNA